MNLLLPLLLVANTSALNVARPPLQSVLDAKPQRGETALATNVTRAERVLVATATKAKPVLLAKTTNAKAKHKPAPVAEPTPPPPPPEPAKPAPPPVNPDELLATWQTKRATNPSFQELEVLTKKLDQAILDFKGVPTQKTVQLQTARVQVMQSAMAAAGRRVDEDPFRTFKTEHERWLAPCASGMWTVSPRGWAVVDDLKSHGLDAESLAAEVGNPRCRTRKTARYDSDLLTDFNAAKEYLKRYPRGANATQALDVYAAGEADRATLTKAMMRDEDASLEDAQAVLDGWQEAVTAAADSEAKTKAKESLADLRVKVEARAKKIAASRGGEP